MARNCLSLQTKFSMRWRALYNSLSKTRHVLRLLLSGITGHRGLARCQEGFDHALIGIKRFVGQHGVGFHLRQERVSAFQIMRLARGQEERKRIAQCVDHEMDFCAQPALLRPIAWFSPSLFWAPALCWWARTIVLSIMALLPKTTGCSWKPFSTVPLSTLGRADFGSLMIQSYHHARLAATLYDAVCPGTAEAMRQRAGIRDYHCWAWAGSAVDQPTITG
jgi:hypothetical protein